MPMFEGLISETKNAMRKIINVKYIYVGSSLAKQETLKLNKYNSLISMENSMIVHLKTVPQPKCVNLEMGVNLLQMQ